MTQVDTADHQSDRDNQPSWALKRAQDLQGLYIHLLIFPILNGGLFFINWVTKGSGGGWWFHWVLLFWGLALAIHLVVTAFPVFTDRWVEDKAHALAEQARAQRN